MSSQQKINSARANGAKSQGPKTEAGRQKSSMNAVTHGLYAASVVLTTESREQHQEMLQAYIQQFQPAGQAELDLVEEMVNAKWRQRRLWAIEADLLEDEMIVQKDKLDEEGSTYDAITPLSFAYRELSSSALSFLTRHESRLERAYSRALKNLLDLQRLRKASQNATQQNLQERTQSQTGSTTPSRFSHHPPPTSHHPPPTAHNPQPTAPNGSSPRETLLHHPPG
jgi:hypothetical protein